MTFKEFMTKHVRKHLPGVYYQLIIDQPAIKKWSDQKYLKIQMGEEMVDGVHYMAHHPFQYFAGEVFTNQRPEIQSFNQFLDDFYFKLEDRQLKDIRDVKSVIW